MNLYVAVPNDGSRYSVAEYPFLVRSTIDHWQTPCRSEAAAYRYVALLIENTAASDALVGAFTALEAETTQIAL